MVRVSVRRPVRAFEWAAGGKKAEEDDGVAVWNVARPVKVGPLTVEAWVKCDKETRRGVFAEVKVSHGNTVLWHEERAGTTLRENAYVLACRMMEEGLTEAHKRIGAMCDEVEAHLRELIAVRDEVGYVMLRKEHRACRLTLETAHLVMLIFYPEVKRPTWLEAITEDVAVAYDERGVPVARIAYDPDDRRNFRGQAGADAVGYQGFTCILWPEDEEDADA